MKNTINITNAPINLRSISTFIFDQSTFTEVNISDEVYQKVEKSHRHLQTLLEKRVPIYGVNTGFGDSLFRSIPIEKSIELQNNLVSYLLCGSGKKLPRTAVRATVLFRLYSLSRGLSGVSPELIQTLKLFLEHDWLPFIPCQGSLGASGDLIPLAYLASVLRGEGELDTPQGKRLTSEVFNEFGIKPYTLKPKEGLAIVNGTSAMCGMAFLNWIDAQALLELSTTATAWLCMVMQGRPEAFGELINEKAKAHDGQSSIAKKIREILDEEKYTSVDFSKITVNNQVTSSLIQDKYSLRCTPQILGPVKETLNLIGDWLEKEINSVSDNPLIDENGELATGGNFYGGYLSQGMDYLKISLGHIADLIDRQLMLVIDEKSNRGLPANLANWPEIKEEERFLHHGLKGLHQSVSAITSEILAKTIPNGIFSRSSESHNQDKVSLGMSAAVQCAEVIESLYTTTTLHLICLAQAIDLRGIRLSGSSQTLYDTIRKHVSFVSSDRALHTEIEILTSRLIKKAHEGKLPNERI